MTKLKFSPKLLKAAGVCLMAVMMTGCGVTLPAIADRAESNFLKKSPVPTKNSEPLQRAPINTKHAPPTTTKVVNDFGTRPMLSSQSANSLRNAISRYQNIVTQGGWPQLPGGKVLVRNSKGTKVEILNQRLAIEGYLPATQITQPNRKFTNQTQEAVRRFQINNGLYAHGKVDETTRRSLNVSAQDRLNTLNANLPRAIEYTKKLSDRYIVVNIPATQLDSVYLGVVHSRHNVIVGKPDRPSPVLLSKVSELNFNPYWNAPKSIVKKDIIPKMLKSLQILKKLNIKIYDGYKGPEVDPKTVDWKTADPERYHFRQEPGGGNAMASVKINFRNKYAVYMHDTPTKQLFSRGARYFSSGCVRVDKVHILTNWILNGQEGWDKSRIDQTVKSGERLDVAIKNPPEVIFAYMTAWADDNGQVHFRHDIYNLDGTGFVSGQPEALSDTKQAG